MNPCRGLEEPAHRDVGRRRHEPVLRQRHAIGAEGVFPDSEEESAAHRGVVARGEGEARREESAPVVEIDEREARKSKERMNLVRALDRGLVSPEHLELAPKIWIGAEDVRVLLRGGGAEAIALVLDAEEQVSPSNPEPPVDPDASAENGAAVLPAQLPLTSDREATERARGGESARGLQDLALRHTLAIGYGILTVENEEQAWARADVTKHNHGGRASQAALRMIEIKRHFHLFPR